MSHVTRLFGQNACFSYWIFWFSSIILSKKRKLWKNAITRNLPAWNDLLEQFVETENRHTLNFSDIILIHNIQYLQTIVGSFYLFNFLLSIKAPTTYFIPRNFVTLFIHSSNFRWFSLALFILFVTSCLLNVLHIRFLMFNISLSNLSIPLLGGKVAELT